MTPIESKLKIIEERVKALPPHNLELKVYRDQIMIECDISTNAEAYGTLISWAPSDLTLLLQITRRLMAATEFYADVDNWESRDRSRTTGNKCFDIMLFDFDRELNPKQDYAGKTARAALLDVQKMCGE